MYCENWMTPWNWGAMEVGAGSLLLLKRHTVILCSLVLKDCSGQRLDKLKNLKYKSATTERGNEKHSIITTTDVQENKRYVHINYDYYFLIN